MAHLLDFAHVIQSAQRDYVGHATTPFHRFLVFLLVLTTATCAATGGIKAEQNSAGLERPENQSAVCPPSIQFDTKGVEFGPWVRKFIAQIRNHWFIPEAGMTDKGHVIVTFYVLKNGATADLVVLKPSSIPAFNDSAYHAVASSNPFAPLPQEYPDERAFFTITFCFNESPPKEPEVVPSSSLDTLREQSTVMTAQTLNADNAFVVRAVLRQSSTTAPLTLTFSEPFMQGKKRMVRRSEITIPASDVIDSLTVQVRSSYPQPGSGEFLIVLNVRSRNIPATTSDPLVFTLASGTVVSVPQSAIDNGATAWLRPNLSGMGRTSIDGTSSSEAGTQVTAKCAKDWPDDFQMRKYCQDKQREAADALQRRTMHDSADHLTIRKKCATDWPVDFQMRDYCEVQQLKALAAIGK